MAAIETAMELLPNYPGWFNGPLWQAQFCLGHYEEAERAIVAAMKSYSGVTSYSTSLAATLAAMGRIDEARAEIAEFLKVNPGWTLQNIRKVRPYKNLEDLDRVIDALRQAGLPE